LGFDLPRVTSVAARGQSVMGELVRHLVRAHGRRRLALISGPEGHLESSEREQAFRSVLEDEGLAFDPGLHHRGNFYTEAGQAGVEAFLAAGRPFDAVVCLNDHMAIGALQALRSHGIGVPYDVAVTGFDDIGEACRVSPPLTTARQPLEALATTALDLLVSKIEGWNPDSWTYDCELVVRQSCGCPPPLPLARPRTEGRPHPARAALEAAALANDAGAVLELISRDLAPQWGRFEALEAWRDRILGLQSRAPGPGPQWSDQALAWLTDEELRWERESQMVRQQASEEVRVHSVRLLGMLRLDAIVRHGEDHFPSLGISRSYLVLFDPATGAPRTEPPATARWLTTTGTPDRSLREVRFDTAALVPPGDEFDWGPRGWLVEPLVYQDEALGYLLLEGGSDEALDFETLREALSTAVKGALLVEEVRNHQKNLALQVKARTRELKAVHRDLQEVSNRTMQTIGQDIHDDLCQHLVGISMLTSVVEETLRARGTVAPEAVAEIRQLTDQAVTRSRQFARTLYPPGLGEHGLVSALEDLVDTMGRPQGTITFSTQGDCRVVHPDHALQLFRIVQESLSNALRHSGSEVILVRLVRTAEGLLAEVRDFGRGLAPGAVGSGMGTRILKDRAESIGARLEIYNLEPGVCVSCFLETGRV